MVKMHNKIIAAILYERISVEHIYCSIIGVIEEYRNKGLFNGLLRYSMRHIKRMNFKYMSIWCNEISIVPNIINQYLTPLSPLKKLSEMEIILRNEFYEFRNKYAGGRE